MKLIIKVIFSAIKGLIGLLLTPLDLLISNVFPDIASGLSYISGFLDWLTDFIRFVLSWLPFSSSFYIFISLCLGFYYLVPLMVHAFKIVINWYIALKP